MKHSIATIAFLATLGLSSPLKSTGATDVYRDTAPIIMKRDNNDRAVHSTAYGAPKTKHVARQFGPGGLQSGEGNELGDGGGSGCSCPGTGDGPLSGGLPPGGLPPPEQVPGGGQSPGGPGGFNGAPSARRNARRNFGGDSQGPGGTQLPPGAGGAPGGPGVPEPNNCPPCPDSCPGGQGPLGGAEGGPPGDGLGTAPGGVPGVPSNGDPSGASVPGVEGNGV
ncbi:hypothetical protein PCL_03963 [Purpureocillium lilacinum]|uniref:Collagen triple helix repeat protein n=1 Tax=Purpureocillium lilacinum TaxID=33203 RepID=A0A2U3EQJ4_PURLI|nr:hypothetical protein PCL_03963 [Purpureocillium lilacinum]